MGRALHRMHHLIAFAALLASAAPAYAQQLGQGSADADLSLWRVFATLLFLLSLVTSAWVLIKARGRPLPIFGPASARQIEIIEVARISPQSTLSLVRFDGAEYLLAMTPNSTTVVEKRPAKPQSVAEAD
jgi:flagellar biogenesis protein FliO